MYNQEEQTFKDLNDKFYKELTEIEKQMERLGARHCVLSTLLFGDPKPEPVEVQNIHVEENEEAEVVPYDFNFGKPIDQQLVTLISLGAGVKRAEINQKMKNHSSKAIDLSLARMRKRGLIISEGKSRGATWYVTNRF